MRPRLVIVGYGMVGHRLLVELADRGALDRMGVTVLGEEPRPAYDRVALSSFFDGVDESGLCLVEEGFAERHGVRVVTGDRVDQLDRGTATVRTEGGRRFEYDHLVLATGSSPFVPPIPGRTLDGCFVYRTIDDLVALQDWCERPEVRTGIVVGGGLLGLEAANALRLLGVEPHVVEMAPRLMPLQLDDGASAALRGHIEALGVTVHLGVRTVELTEATADGVVGSLVVEDGPPLPADVVVFSAGIRPRDELARAAGLATGERGGVCVDARLCSVDDPMISAIGEVASVGGRCHGLVAPGYEMAAVVAARLARTVAGSGAAGEEPGDDPSFGTPDASTKLKLLGVDVASFGDAFGDPEATDALVWDDPRSGVHRRLVVDRTSGDLVGGMLVGDAEGYGMLRLMASGDVATPPDLSGLLAPAGDRTAGAVGPDALPDAATVCSCTNVTAGALRAAVEGGCRTTADLASCTGATSGCGGCGPLVGAMLTSELTKAGIAVDTRVCPHFDLSRAELFSLVRFHRYRTWDEVRRAHGRGRGCEVCKPVVASILASVHDAYVLDDDRGSIQDSNDHVLANIQRNGTYSVVPRVPGGEIRPDQLIAIGEVARDFGLYAKITGGQRIDLLGARLEQLPPIWGRLADVGLESGQAYGKSLRTVKSCVGDTWCRYGVQDSTSMAIDLELRYRGLRAPHKLKMAVSGCARECAEARSKDVGVIATEQGWNLYVAGNGGARPRHADLLATDLDDEALVRTIDRFLMYYVRTADRLQRTSAWFESLGADLDHLRGVLFGDSLGIVDELDADMAAHVDAYRCEWAESLADPSRLSRFVTFVNAPDAADPDIVMVEERGQLRPLRDAEREIAVAIR